MHTRWVFALIAMALLAASCDSTAVTTSTTAFTTTTSSTTTTSTSTTSTTSLPVTVTLPPATTTTTIPLRPVVATGWELRPGDLIAADQTGVSILRDGEPVAAPVSTPAARAIGIGANEMVISHRGQLWRVDSEGSAAILYGSGGLLDVLDAPGFGLGGWVAFTEGGLLSETESYSKYVGLINLATETVILLPVEIGEGGVTGVAVYGDSVVVGASTDGPAFFAAWTNRGTTTLLPNNPAPRDAEDWSIRRSLLVSTGPNLLGYVEDVEQLDDAEEYLVVFDPATGRELVREEIPGSSEKLSHVWGLDADSDRIVVTTGIYSLDEQRFYYMAHEFDRATGTWVTSFAVRAPVRLAKWFGGYQLAG